MTTVYVTPYIKGPAPTPATRPRHFTFNQDDCRLFVRLAVLRLSPRMQRRHCRPMFFFETATLTFCAATALAYAFAAPSIVSNVLLVVDTALLAALLVAATSLAGRDCRRHQHIAHVARFECPLAFRLTNEEYCRALRQSRPAGKNDQSSDWGFHRLEAVTPEKLQAGDVILVEEGQYIYADGMILRGVATVDESAVTGRSMCVLREAGGVSEVMHDTLVVAGRILVEVTPRLGHPLDWISGTTDKRDSTSRADKSPLSV
jgi:high-affinity K+ transport system ATPase subunit B